MLVALDAAAFVPREEFEAQAEAFCAELAGTAPAQGFDEVLVPGEIERRTRARRAHEGIPIPAATWSELEALKGGATSMSRFIRETGRRQPRRRSRHATPKSLRRVVAGATVGTALEWYDFFIYGTAAALVFGDLFFDPASGSGTLVAFATFGVGFVARPFGGMLFGHLGDRIGRRETLIITTLVMGLSTGAIGLLPTYASIGIWAPILLVAPARAPGPGRRRRVRRRVDAARRARAEGAARLLLLVRPDRRADRPRAGHAVVPARRDAARRRS